MAKKKKVVKKKKVIKKKKKELTPQQIRQKKIDALRDKYLEAIKKFDKEHFVYMFCYPSGRRMDGKGNDISDVTRNHIYACKTMCEHGLCREFERKIYLCRELKCNNWPNCIFYDEDKMKKTCKKEKLWKKRSALDKLYERFFLYYRIYRGFKLDQEKTLKYLKKKAKKNGKVQHKKDRKESSSNRKKKTKKHKKGSKVKKAA